MRIKATIAYDGSRFYGFQHQPNRPTVVSALQHALRTLRIDTTIVGSGRTDRNVHATGQVIHFDVPSYWYNTKKLHRLLNERLEFIQIRSLHPIHANFHARYDAKMRLYRYLFALRPPHVFERPYIVNLGQLDRSKLQKALDAFIGTYDFSGFSKSGSNVSTTIRTIYRSQCFYYKDKGVITFLGNAFLRSQVRLMVAAAAAYAKGDISLEAIIHQRDRQDNIIRKPAPAQGLYLTRIVY